jgi:hypothetical protein
MGFYGGWKRRLGPFLLSVSRSGVRVSLAVWQRRRRARRS